MEEAHHTNFNPLMGTVLKEEQMRFKKLIFRASRGMAHVSFFDLKEKLYDYQGKSLDKLIYIVFFPLNFEYLRSKLSKICDSFAGEKV